MKPITYILITLFLSSLLISCDSNRVFEENKEIENDRWHKDDFVKFSVDITDRSVPVNFYVSIRNSTDYNFSNLYLFVRTKWPDGTLLADTINCRLAENKGSWTGRGIGKYRQNMIMLSQHATFPQKGIYEFEFEQAMRVEELEGINSIGIRIEKSSPKK